MILRCLICGNDEHFPAATSEEAIAVDPRLRCATCREKHYVCYGCIGRLGLRDVPKHQLPCFESDEAQVANEFTRGGR